MPLLRNLLFTFSFLLGWVSLFHLAVDFHLAFSGSASTTLLLLSPLLVGLLLALVSARSFVARQWQKGPALLLAAATLARLTTGLFDFSRLQQRQAESWFDVFLGLAFHLLWLGLMWLLAAVVYRSSERIFAATGRALAKLLRRSSRNDAAAIRDPSAP